jgi:hypothetical protein
MPYLNKRNRFIQAAKQFADANNVAYDCFTKSNLLLIAQSINMKGIPTWVLQEHVSRVSKGVYDLTPLFPPASVSV